MNLIDWAGEMERTANTVAPINQVVADGNRQLAKLLREMQRFY